jgi:hypothetical protein
MSQTNVSNRGIGAITVLIQFSCNENLPVAEQILRITMHVVRGDWMGRSFGIVGAHGFSFRYTYIQPVGAYP